MRKRRRHSEYEQPGGIWRQQFGGMPLWGIVGGLALVLVMAAGALSLRPETVAADPNRQPRPIPTFNFGTPAEAMPLAVFVGDSYTAGSGEDSGDQARYPALLTERLPIRSIVSAFGGNGYTLADEHNFTTLVAAVPANASTVVVFGSLNDQDGYDVTAEGVRSAFAALRERTPDATVIVVGPPSPERARGANVPAALLATRDAVREITAEYDFQFVDAIEWFADRPDLIGADRIHPNDAGHQFLADQIGALVAPTLPAS